jgi:5-formyltetrahydrofolate cyclo-ligase
MALANNSPQDALAAEKQAFRSTVKETLRSLPAARFTEAGIAIAAQIAASDAWQGAYRILCFLSTLCEVGTTPLLEAALSCGKRVYLPVVRGRDMRFYRIDSLDTQWTAGAFGIREPPIVAEREFSLAQSDGGTLVITPGLAFGRDRTRLGRGGGYYDRFFAACEDAGLSLYCAGICLDEQLFPGVPCADYDRKVDAVYAA